MKRTLRLLPLLLILLVPFGFRSLHRVPDPPVLRQAGMAQALQIARAAVAEGAGLRALEADEASGSHGRGTANPVPKRDMKPATKRDMKPATKRDMKPATKRDIQPATDLATDAGAAPVFGAYNASVHAKSTALEVDAFGPVTVTLYPPGRRRGQAPPQGFWWPRDAPTSLQEAIRQAGLEAGKNARRLDLSPTTLIEARIKLDLGGTPGALWFTQPQYLTVTFDEGRDGLIGSLGTRQAAMLPSAPVESGQDALALIKTLRKKLRDSSGSADIRRYRTSSFMDGVRGEPGPLSVFRGNVLLQELDAETIRESLRQSGRYLARMINQRGRYCYTYNVSRDRCDRNYNLLRHAGTTYSLYQIYQIVPERALLEAAERATEWLRRQVRPIEGDPTRVYMLEGTKAKLGALGLGLLAMVEREKVLQDGRDRALMRQQAAFIQSQQREDGYFYSWYQWDPKVPIPTSNSIYYPGEALLGLIRLHDIDPQPQYLETAVKAARFLALERWRWAGIELYIPPDAWLTQALAELYFKAPDERLKDYCYGIVRFSEQTMLRFEDGVAPDMVGGPSNGLWLPPVTPAGSRNEGTTAAYQLARHAGDKEIQSRIRDVALRSVRFQLNQQYRPANLYFALNPAKALGGFRGRADSVEVRIDYVQHNATGLIGVLKILEEEGVAIP